MPQRNTIEQIDASMKNVTKQELQERWEHLALKTSTLLHLQEMLDRRGIIAAAAVTDILVREKRPKMADIGKEWGFEELRLISLEGIRPHLIDLIRVILETLMAWHFIHVPEGAIDGMVEIVLAALFALGAICFTCRGYSKEQVSRTRGKRPLMMLLFTRKRAKSLPPNASSH